MFCVLLLLAHTYYVHTLDSRKWCKELFWMGFFLQCVCVCVCYFPKRKIASESQFIAEREETFDLSKSTHTWKIMPKKSCPPFLIRLNSEIIWKEINIEANTITHTFKNTFSTILHWANWPAYTRNQRSTFAFCVRVITAVLVMTSNLREFYYIIHSAVQHNTA